ncbi:Glycogen debranching enzyme, partial [Neolecta irregularis DAH-3]
MTVAPELFTSSYAIEAIAIADKVIRGPTGIRTLDPADLDYRPFYFNGDDSNDFHTAQGRNYHQGPEWLWCTGFFFRAFLKFVGPHKGMEQTVQWLFERMKPHREMICNSMWRGLAELTNKDNQFCPDSCPTQAWSAGTLLDLMDDIHKVKIESNGK